MSTPIKVGSVGVVSTLGIGFDAFKQGLQEGAARPAETISAALFPNGKAPTGRARRMADFDPAEHLGSKGISTLDRSTQFSILACKQVIEAAPSAKSWSANAGVVLGSAGGSFKSIADFVRSTYESASPHLVSPLLFPNTVMNCAAAQCAIWHRLRGVNSTVCSGELSGLAALMYAGRMLRMRHADRLIAGSVEEYCDFSAWSHHATACTTAEPLGEGAAVFDLSLDDGESATGEPVDAQLLAVQLTSRFREGEPPAAILGRLLHRSLQQAGVVPEDIVWWSPHRGAGSNQLEAQREALALTGIARESLVPVAADLDRRIGSTYAASTSLQLAAVIATAPPGVGVVTAISGTEQIGCAVVRIPPRTSH